MVLGVGRLAGRPEHSHDAFPLVRLEVAESLLERASRSRDLGLEGDTQLGVALVGQPRNQAAVVTPEALWLCPELGQHWRGDPDAGAEDCSRGVDVVDAYVRNTVACSENQREVRIGDGDLGLEQRPRVVERRL